MLNLVLSIHGFNLLSGLDTLFYRLPHPSKPQNHSIGLSLEKSAYSGFTFLQKPALLSSDKLGFQAGRIRIIIIQLILLYVAHLMGYFYAYSAVSLIGSHSNLTLTMVVFDGWAAEHNIIHITEGEIHEPSRFIH
jgi:hypothetical protein